jgi:hypothetical protein
MTDVLTSENFPPIDIYHQMKACSWYSSSMAVQGVTRQLERLLRSIDLITHHAVQSWPHLTSISLVKPKAWGMSHIFRRWSQDSGEVVIPLTRRTRLSWQTYDTRYAGQRAWAAHVILLRNNSAK